jgi:hypothetical protein
MTKNLKRILALLACSSAIVHAGVIPLDNFNLLPFQFTYNYPYVFSDRVPEDQTTSL